MRTTLCRFACMLLLLCSRAFGQQSPDPGTVSGNVYSNDFFHFSYTIPDGWSVKTAELAAKLGNHGTAPLLYVTKAPDSYAAVGITFQDLSGTSLWRAKEYLDGLEAATQALPAGKRTSHNFGSREFERQDFEITPATHYVSYIAGMVRGYGLVFTIDANSHAELEALARTVTEAKFAPDWSSGVPAGQGCPDLPTEASGKANPLRVRVSAGVAEGNLVNKITPKYPGDARQHHIQGTVVMTALIGCDGAMRWLSVNAGSPALIQATLDAVSQWTYRPYTLNGKPVEVETMIMVNFELL